MTKAAELAKMGEVLTNSQIGGRRNIIINGAMQVFQRGTSFTSVSNTAYHADRFELYMQNEASVYTVTQDSDAPNGFANSLKLDVTTADTSIASNEEVKLFHKLEGQDLQQLKKGTSDAEQMTLSFYVKTNKTGTYCVELYDRDNNRDVSASYTVSDTGWSRYTLTFPADTTGAFDDDNASSLEIQFWLVAGSAVQGGTLNTSWRSAADGSSATGQVNFSDSTDNNWAITGIQLEVGEQATPFEHRSYGEELALCQRYYWRSTGANFHAIGSGLCQSSTEGRATIPNPVDMRALPTLGVGGTLSGNVAASTQDVTSIGSSWSGKRANMVGFAITGASLGAAFMIHHKDNTSNYFDADSEL
jgi:hypothetical protein